MKRILLIEDDVDLRRATADVLEAEGYRVITARDGTDGIEKAFLERPDLILCDIQMPRLSGYDVFRILQENPTTNLTPFIFVTAKRDYEDIRTGMQLGVDDYLTKPFDYNELIATIHTRLNKSERQQRLNDERYRVFLDNSLTGVFVASGYRILYANQKLAKLLNYEPETLRRLRPFSLIYAEDRPLLKRNIRRCTHTINPMFHTTFRVLPHFGMLLELELHAGLTTYDNQPALIGTVIEPRQQGQKGVQDISPDDLKKAVDLLAANQMLITPALLKQLNDIFHLQIGELHQAQNPDKLTEREREVLQLICEGYSSAQIAERLSLSPRTIDRHRANLLDKSNSRNTVDLAIYAIRNHLVKIT